MKMMTTIKMITTMILLIMIITRSVLVSCVKQFC